MGAKCKLQVSNSAHRSEIQESKEVMTRQFCQQVTPSYKDQIYLPKLLKCEPVNRLLFRLFENPLCPGQTRNDSCTHNVS